MINKRSISFSRGFDRGNYGSAYYSQTDWHSFYAENCVGPTTIPPEEFNTDDWCSGLILGFHATLEIHEIEDNSVAEEVDKLRKLLVEER